MTPPDDNARLKELDEKLKALSSEGGRLSDADSNKNAKETAKAYNFAWRIFTDFVACIGCGGGLGYALDWFFNTMPIFLLLGLVFGLAAGMLTIYKLAVHDMDQNE